MATVLLLRHGLTAMTGPVLAGHTPGVHLDERGRAQATAVAERLRPAPLAAIVTSPLERCGETAGFVAAGRELPVGEDEVILYRVVPVVQTVRVPYKRMRLVVRRTERTEVVEETVRQERVDVEED